MTPFKPALVLLLALSAAFAHAAERGIYTLVDGDVRVLRGATWFALVAGARAEEGDVIDVAERAQAQLELPRGGVLNMQGPALARAIALPLSDEKANAADIALQRGWFKAAAVAKGSALRLRLPTATVDIADAIVVVHDNLTLAELFVERGRARVSIPAVRGKEAPAREAKEGGFWRRAGDRPFIAEERPPPAFVAAMPRDLRDPLPVLASRYAAASPPLVAGRDVTFAEAEPWLSGPARKAFIKRFTPRLSDPGFRAAAAARPIPEWDRILHPEKYRR